MRHLKTYQVFESLLFVPSEEHANPTKDDYHNLMMVLHDLFDEWKILYHSNESFDDEENPKHSFWAFRDNSGDIMTSDINSIGDVKDMVIYNIPVDEDEDKFKNEVLSYKEQIEGITGKKFHIKEEIIDSIYSDYILRLV